MRVALQHWLSVARLALGAAVWLSIARSDRSVLVLPFVILACVLDFSDGRLARAFGAESPIGRALDNVCDFVFLALFFHAVAAIHLWSDPGEGVLFQYWEGVNTLPLVALGMSFGSYGIRSGCSVATATPILSSPIGRAAGVLNYALALLGAAIISIDPESPPVLAEGSMVLVALFNVAAFAQNGSILLRQIRRGAT